MDHLHTLFSEGFQEYLTIAQKANRNKLIVYLHVPKAAGNSSLHHIKKYKKNYFNVKWDRIDESWAEFLSKINEKKYNLVSGHFSESHVTLLRDKRIPHVCVTFIRNPIERLVSQYKYMTTEAHPDYKRFTANFPSFEDFVFNMVPPNPIARMLTGGNLSYIDTIDYLLDKFHFIGMKEFYNTSMFLLCEILNIPFNSIQKRNVTKTNEINNFELSYSTFKKLKEIHNLDIQIHKYFHDKYQKIADEIVGINCVSSARLAPINITQK